MVSTTTHRPGPARTPAASASDLKQRGFAPDAPSTAPAHDPTGKLAMVAIEKGGLIVVAAEGSITATDVDPSRKNPFETLLGGTWFTNRVLLDMSRAGYIDSSAIGWLLSSHKTFSENGGGLAIHGLQPAVRQLLDVLKLGRVLTLATDEATARQQLQSNGGAK